MTVTNSSHLNVRITKKGIHHLLAHVPGCLLGGLLQVGDQVRPVLLLPQPGEDHLGAGDELARFLQVLVQRLGAPRDALVHVGLHGKADNDEEVRWWMVPGCRRIPQPGLSAFQRARASWVL